MRFIVTDTETIGLNPPASKRGGVCQVAWLDFHPETHEMGEVITHLVNPEAPIAPGATAVHGITDDMVKDKPTLGEVFKFDGPIVTICHNTPFDLKFLSPYIDHLAGDICTLRLSRQLYPSAPNHKLTTMIDYLGLERGKAHDAGGDIFMTAQLLQHFLKKMAPRTLESLYKSEQAPKMVHIVPFGKFKGQPFMNMDRSYLEWILAQGNDMPPDMTFTANKILAMKG